MLSVIDFEQIYSGMIAGRVPNHDGDVNLTIFYLARSILGTEKMHLLVSLSEDRLHAYYFAAPSASFASTSDFETPLAAAFPKHQDHKGDGIYLLTAGSLAAAVVKQGEKFRLLTNSTEAIEAMIDDSGLPLHNVEAFRAMRMDSISSAYRRLADTLSRTLIRVGAITAVTALGIGVVAFLANTIFTTTIRNSNEQIARDLNSLVSKIDHASPLSRQLGQLQRISATVVRAGGWIDAYDASAKGEKFAVSLPAWVTQDFVAALGSGTVAEMDNSSNMIKVEKK